MRRGLEARLARLEAAAASPRAARRAPRGPADGPPLEAYAAFIRGERVPELDRLEEYRGVFEMLMRGELGPPPGAMEMGADGG